MDFLWVGHDNICLSPMAEGIMRQIIKRHNYIFEVDSAGLSVPSVGMQPCESAIQIMKSHNIDISKHRARKFIENDLAEFYFILTLSRSTYESVIQMTETEKQRKKVRDISEYVEVTVPDMNCNAEISESVYQTLSEACEKVIWKIVAVR